MWHRQLANPRQSVKKQYMVTSVQTVALCDKDGALAYVFVYT